MITGVPVITSYSIHYTKLYDLDLVLDYENFDTSGWDITFWFFQSVFAGTAATIVSGGMAERTKFSSYILSYNFV